MELGMYGLSVDGTLEIKSSIRYMDIDYSYTSV